MRSVRGELERSGSQVGADRSLQWQACGDWDHVGPDRIVRGI